MVVEAARVPHPTSIVSDRYPGVQRLRDARRHAGSDHRHRFVMCFGNIRKVVPGFMCVVTVKMDRRYVQSRSSAPDRVEHLRSSHWIELRYRPELLSGGLTP